MTTPFVGVTFPLAKRTISVRVTPPPVSFAERRSILQVLEQHGKVEVFKKVPGHDSMFISMMRKASDATTMITTSPLNYNVVTPRSTEETYIADLNDSKPLTNTRPTTVDSLTGHESQEVNQKRFTIHVWPCKDYHHGRATQSSPLHQSWPSWYDKNNSFLARTLKQSLPQTLAAKGLAHWDLDLGKMAQEEKEKMAERVEVLPWMPSKWKRTGGKDATQKANRREDRRRFFAQKERTSIFGKPPIEQGYGVRTARVCASRGARCRMGCLSDDFRTGIEGKRRAMLGSARIYATRPLTGLFSLVFQVNFPRHTHTHTTNTGAHAHDTHTRTSEVHRTSEATMVAEACWCLLQRASSCLGEMPGTNRSDGPDVGAAGTLSTDFGGIGTRMLESQGAKPGTKSTKPGNISSRPTPASRIGHFLLATSHASNAATMGYVTASAANTTADQVRILAAKTRVNKTHKPRTSGPSALEQAKGAWAHGGAWVLWVSWVFWSHGPHGSWQRGLDRQVPSAELASN
ncbi:hypothetical protein G7046_g660 [Stylonectria norvegica]|nr:hypothetical protein G7046_g660 [Stylonectria norvegica]